MTGSYRIDSEKVEGDIRLLHFVCEWHLEYVANPTDITRELNISRELCFLFRMIMRVCQWNHEAAHIVCWTDWHQMAPAWASVAFEGLAFYERGFKGRAAFLQ